MRLETNTIKLLRKITSSFHVNNKGEVGVIQAFEAGRAPQVNDPKRIIGIYIVLLTGEAVLYDFDVLQIFIDKERPEAEVYIKAYEEKQAAEAQV